MSDFMEREGAYSYVIIAVLSFLLGILSSLIIEVLKRRAEKDRLIDLFIADIRRNWKSIDQLKHSPVGQYWSRMVFIFKGVDNLSFTGHPEYEFEVHNIKFYETEGFKLVHYLGREARKQFWDVYGLIRDAEAARQLLRSLPLDHKDRTSYQTLFARLVESLAGKLSQFEQTLDEERPLNKKLLIRLRKNS